MSYLKKVLLFSISIFISLYIFNISVDPYDKFNINFWNVKTKAVSSYRDNKFHQIDSTNKKYDLFIIGSSRVQRFNPEYIKEITGYETFNYGVNNSKPEDLLAITKHIVHKQKPKFIFLQTDFYNLNENILMDKRLENSPLKKYLDNKVLKENDGYFYFYEKSYLTLSSVKDSLKVIYKNYIGSPEITHKMNGMFVRKKPPEIVGLAKPYFKNEYKDYTFSKKRINYFKEIKEICLQNNIKLIVSISPMNKEHYIKIKSNSQLFERFIEFKKNIVDIFGDIYDFNTPCAFEYDYPYWGDSVHPSEELSIIMSDVIFKNEKVGCFGENVNHDNISEHIQKLK